jgi:5-methylcytosine-specific restriction endonuclease McrA
MSATAKQRRILAIIATDATFELARQGDRRVWVGKCIFCNRALSIAADGTPISAATIEHIWPRTHGGDDALENLALACVGCNREKGGRHDTRHRRDARLGEIVEALRAKRRERWREPPPELAAHVAFASR